MLLVHPVVLPEVSQLPDAHVQLVTVCVPVESQLLANVVQVP